MGENYSWKNIKLSRRTNRASNQRKSILNTKPPTNPTTISLAWIELEKVLLFFLGSREFFVFGCFSEEKNSLHRQLQTKSDFSCFIFRFWQRRISQKLRSAAVFIKRTGITSPSSRHGNPCKSYMIHTTVKKREKNHSKNSKVNAQRTPYTHHTEQSSSLLSDGCPETRIKSSSFVPEKTLWCVHIFDYLSFSALYVWRWKRGMKFNFYCTSCHGIGSSS